MMRALAIIDGEHYAPVVRDALARAAVRVRRRSARRRDGEAARRRRLRRAARRRRSRPRSSARAGARGRPLRRAGARRRASGMRAREPRARARPAVRRAGLPLRAAALAPFPLPSLAVDRDRQAGRQDRRHRARRAAARARPRRGRRRDGPRRARPSRRSPRRSRRSTALLELSRGGRHAASDYLETAALAGVVDDRLPALRRRARGRARESNVLAGAALAAEREPELVDLRRQRRGDPAGRDRRAASSSPARAAARRRDRLPERLPDPRLRPRGRHGRTRRAAGRGDPRAQGPARRLGRAAAAAGRAGRSAGASPSSPPRRGRARAIERHLRESSAPRSSLVSGNLARREALREDLARATTPRSTSSRSRRPRSTSSPRRRSSAGWRSCSPTTSSSRSACSTSTRSCSGWPTRRSRARRWRVTDRGTGEPLPLGGEDGLPFSKGLLARALTATGISTDRAYELALAAEADIAQSAASRSRFERLGELAAGELGEEDGATTMRRLHRFQDLYDLDLPIILLVGGATGTGKSTVATDVAYRLGITRVTSTDFVRQTMRAFFSRGVHAGDPLLELRGRPRDRRRRTEAARPCSTASSSRPATCWSACRPRSSARSRRAGRWCSRASTSSPGCCRVRSVGALVVQCVLAINDAEAHAEPLLDPRHRLRGRAAVREVPRRVRRHPPGAGVHPRPREEARGAGDRERQHRGRDRRGDGARAERAEPLEVRP